MKTIDLLRWLRNKIHTYNLFIPEDDEYDDTDDALQDPAILVRYQRYATRLYVPLLILTLYILFFIAFVVPQNQVITIDHFTPPIFDQLRLKYDKTLSCPCSTTNVPYSTFVSNTISFHPVCSSVFVKKEWIEALYLLNASQFLTMDFRTTASSQFEILAALCSISQDTVARALADLNNTQLITIQALQEYEVQSQVNGNIELIKATLSRQIIPPLNFFQMTTRLNSLISALNTNAVIRVTTYNDQQISVNPTFHFNKSASNFDALYGSPCNLKNSTAPAGFYLLSSYGNPTIHLAWPEYPPYFEPIASAMVDGFFGGCTSLDALLASTFDCLYNINCLELFGTYFPGLNNTNLTWIEIFPESNRKNVSLNDRLVDLLVEYWITNIDYLKYLDNCDPRFCTYTRSNQANFSYTITLLLGLYGGLTIILRMIAIFLVNISSKSRRRLSTTTFITEYHMTYRERFMRWARKLNMFKSAAHRTVTDIEQQRITTYVYLILLAGSVFTLLMFTSLKTGTITITELNPLLTTYKRLPKLPGDTLKCPCMNISVPYNIFTTLNTTLHQVCSSNFTSESWIALLRYLDPQYNYNNPYIWRGLGAKHFQLLSTICQLANKTINDATYNLYNQSFVTSNVLTESDFYAQLNSTLIQFKQSLIVQFSSLINMVDLFTQVDQPYTTYDNAELIFDTKTNETNDQQLLQLKFNLTGIQGINSSYVGCICATDPNCQNPVAVYGWKHTSNGIEDTTTPYLPPSMTMSCFTIDTLLLSSLQCYYFNSCLAVVYGYINFTLLILDTETPFFLVQPLVDDPALNRFSPNTSLSVIVKEMMIEQWAATSSFESYYEACKPTSCVYSYKTRTVTFIDLVIKLISTIGGLTVALRLITPQLVEFGLSLLGRKKKRKKQNKQKLFDRIKEFWRKLKTFIYTTLIDLNIFSISRFGSYINRRKAKRLGQLATRLYIILIIIGFAVLTLYTAIQPQILTETVPNPSLHIYNQLMNTHSDTLQCPCSSISSTYDRFIKIQPLFHAICSSPFASDQWRMRVTANLVPDLSAYIARDYRRFISAHLQFLSGLCNLSIQMVNDSINQFLSSFFITVPLLSQQIFTERIDLLIDQSKSNAPVTFNRLLSILRAINHGNAIISAYGTNFEYIDPWSNLANAAMITRPITYADECSCALKPNCTTQANFVKLNSSKILPVKGFKIGCTPSESFLASTLECFYDISCINLIQEQMGTIDLINSTDIFEPLSANMSQFSINTVISDLVEKLFIENWSTAINYSAYFYQCAPSLCSYTYKQELNSLYTVTILLGLCGGLTVILQWICPNIIYLLAKIHLYWKKRTNIVEPASTIEMATIETTNATLESKDVTRVVVDSTSISDAPIYSTNLFSTLMRGFIFSIILFILMAVAVIVTSISLNSQGQNQGVVTTLPSNTITSAANETIVPTIATSISATTICQLTFQPIIAYSTGPNSQSASVAVADINNDGRLDLAIANYGTGNVGILLGQNNGSFSAQQTFSTGNGSIPVSVAVGDFDENKQLDLAVAIVGTGNIAILLGNGYGTFRMQRILSTEGIPVSIVVDDFNSDGHLDLAVANEKFLTISVLPGNGDGSFRAERIFSVGVPGYPNTIAIGDFNTDGFLDLAVSNGVLDNVAVLLNDGNGYFDVTLTYPVERFSTPNSIAVGDFNNDGILDLVVANSGENNVGIMLGRGNAEFQAQMTFSTGFYSYPNSVAVNDFNNDGQLDVVVSNSFAHNVGVLLGVGNGTFLPQMTFWIGVGNSQPTTETGINSILLSIASGDVNGDGKLDIVITDSMLNRVGILLNTCDCCVPELLNNSITTY